MNYKTLLFSILGIVFLFLKLQPVFSQVPKVINYQAVAFDGNGECIKNGDISVRLSIRDSGPFGSILYQEEHISIQTDINGLFKISMGEEGSPPTNAGEFDELGDIIWPDQERFFEVELDPSGGVNFNTVHIERLVSVPFALAAGNGKRYANSNQDEYIQFRGTNNNLNVVIGGIGPAGAKNHGRINVFNSLGEPKASIFSHNGSGDEGSGAFRGFGKSGLRSLELGPVDKISFPNNGSLQLFNVTNGSEALKVDLKSHEGGYGFLSLFGPNGSKNIGLEVVENKNASNRGAIRIFDEEGLAKQFLGISNSSNGIQYLYGPNGTRTVGLSSSSFTNSPDYGAVRIYDDADFAKHFIGISGSSSAGVHRIYGPNRNRNLEFSARSFLDDPNSGAIRIYNNNDVAKIYLGLNENGDGLLNLSKNNNGVKIRAHPNILGAGEIILSGLNGNPNIIIGNEGVDPDEGEITVRDGLGNVKVSIGIDGQGRGYVNAGTFNGTILGVKVHVVTIPCPKRDDRTIHYSSLEGPEMAIFERGTINLENGKAKVKFSDHFSSLVNSKTLTILLTPRSSTSKGLAASEYLDKGFSIQELWAGTGSYLVDWEAKGKRKGEESYQVIRKNELTVQSSSLKN